jgi:hypothetical protein
LCLAKKAKTTIKNENWYYYRIRHDKVRETFEKSLDCEEAGEPQPSDAQPETASEQIPLDLT